MRKIKNSAKKKYCKGCVWKVGVKCIHECPDRFKDECWTFLNDEEIAASYEAKLISNNWKRMHRKEWKEIVMKNLRKDIELRHF